MTTSTADNIVRHQRFLTQLLRRKMPTACPVELDEAATLVEKSYRNERNRKVNAIVGWLKDNGHEKLADTLREKFYEDQ